MPELSHDALARSLADSLRNEHRMTWCDLQLGPAGSPRPDVYTIQKSYVRPTPMAYECKVSTSDFRGDVTSGKWQAYLRYACGVYFASSDALLSKELVPDHCGLMLRNASGVWRTAKKATLRPVEIPEEALLKLLINGVEREGPIYRARHWNASIVTMRLGKQFGDDVAKVLTDIERARFDVRGAQYQAERIIEHATKQAESIRAEAVTHIEPVRRDLCEALGLEPTADRYQISGAVQKLKSQAAEHPSQRQLRSLTEIVRRALDSYGFKE